MRIAISTFADTDHKTGWAWGDYWVKYHLSQAFKKLGHHVVKDKCDLLLELYGNSPNLVHNYTIKACWFYSHPESMNMWRAKQYHVIFSLSKWWAQYLRKQGYKSVMYMPGCTHLVGKLAKKTSLKHDIVFVGNTRLGKEKKTKYGRWVIDALDPEATGLPLDLYGLRWQKFAAARKYWRGKEWHNLQLHELYGRARISLADCHDLMASQGFVPIRLYDIVASGGFCISRHVKGIKEIFGNAVVTYGNKKDLLDKVKFYLTHEKARRERIMEGLGRMRGFTYMHRAKDILKVVKRMGV